MSQACLKNSKRDQLTGTEWARGQVVGVEVGHIDP